MYKTKEQKLITRPTNLFFNVSTSGISGLTKSLVVFMTFWIDTLSKPIIQQLN
jgi:tetrahydromethanopterin S-methyltransferase subunit F